jgi:hypothetical protein
MKLIGSDRFSADTQHGAADEGKDPQEQDRPSEIRSLGSFEPVEKRNEKQGCNDHAAEQDIE